MALLHGDRQPVKGARDVEHEEKKTRAKKPKSSGVPKLPVRRMQGCDGDRGRKRSENIEEIALRVEQDTVVTAHFGPTTSQTRHPGAKRDRPIAKKLIRKMKKNTRGQGGELWYVRVLPPPLPGSEHVVFTTPYLLLRPGQREWQAYFDRTLPDAPLEERIARHEHHMKYGPVRDYWTEFVFEAYVNHQTDVIFLAGLPDVAESRPHSRVNDQ